MIEVVKYTSDKKTEWDDFVKRSDIPIFMFLRDYMDYHKDRFSDYSLMLYFKNKLIALLPGHLIDDKYCSHQGLTFGGLILKPHYGYQKTKETLNTINTYLTTIGIKSVTLKLSPSIYSKTYSQSQTHIYQKNILRHSDLKIAACIYSKNHFFPKSTIEKRKLKLNQFNLRYSENFGEFWRILEINLKEHHNTKPVHSLKEILFLKSEFPEEIKLYIAENKITGAIDAGAVLYQFKNTLKLQYQAASAIGKTNRASHALYFGFIKDHIKQVDFIDLGNCMDDTDVINEDLLYFKERFGATVYSMPTYEYETHFEFR